MTGVIAVMPYMPRFETVNVAPDSSDGVTSPCGRAPPDGVTRRRWSRATSGLRRRSWYNQGMVSGDGDPDVDARVQLEAAVAKGTVRERMVAERERRGLDDHVVEGRTASADVFELFSECICGVHHDFCLHLEVRDGGLRLGHPPGDQCL